MCGTTRTAGSLRDKDTWLLAAGVEPREMLLILDHKSNQSWNAVASMIVELC